MRREQKRVIWLTVGFIAVSTAAWAQSDILSEEEAFANFKRAAAALQGEEVSPPGRAADLLSPAPVAKINPPQNVLRKTSEGESIMRHATQVTSTPDENAALNRHAARLEDVPIKLDVENKTLQQTFDVVMNQVAIDSGLWKTRWRLENQNSYLLNERVNLTAETNFQSFIEYLVDRVNNMTGIQLFVTVFDASRIIVISDTYY